MISKQQADHFLYVSVWCLCVWCVFTCMLTCMHQKPGVNVRCLPLWCPPFFFFWRQTLTDPGIDISARLQGPTCPHTSSTEGASAHHHTWLLCGCWGSSLGSSCLCSKALYPGSHLPSLQSMTLAEMEFPRWPSYFPLLFGLISLHVVILKKLITRFAADNLL